MGFKSLFSKHPHSCFFYCLILNQKLSIIFFAKYEQPIDDYTRLGKTMEMEMMEEGWNSSVTFAGAIYN